LVAKKDVVHFWKALVMELTNKFIEVIGVI